MYVYALYVCKFAARGRLEASKVILARITAPMPRSFSLSLSLSLSLLIFLFFPLSLFLFPLPYTQVFFFVCAHLYEHPMPLPPVCHATACEYERARLARISVTCCCISLFTFISHSPFASRTLGMPRSRPISHKRTHIFALSIVDLVFTIQTAQKLQ